MSPRLRGPVGVVVADRVPVQSWFQRPTQRCGLHGVPVWILLECSWQRRVRGVSTGLYRQFDYAQNNPRTGIESCVNCFADTYEQANAQCHRCTANSSSPVASISWRNCTCDQGYKGNHVACLACPAGTYKNWTDAGACELCPRGKFNHYSAATSSGACVDCHSHSIQLQPPLYTADAECLCLAGYEPQQSTCVACLAGTWKWEGDCACLSCPANTYYPMTALPPYC